ncbi:MAG: Crp/Fnr family transcriptional regulator, partial [Lachnospiraceae bacterium]|nr:Crp/Fnr family transcriptional regulator [Lachnospiraceae bacterium]
YSKGECIAFEEDMVRHIGIVVRGSVHMVKEDVWGNSTIMARMTRGHLFGESAACGNDSMSVVTFQAAENTEVLMIPFERIMSTCCNSCGFHQQVIKNMVILLSNKNHALMEKIEVVSRKTLREKILSYLSQESQRQGRRYFEIPLGRMELADYLCTDRSALTRELGKMRQEGLIDYDKNMFRLF